MKQRNTLGINLVNDTLIKVWVDFAKKYKMKPFDAIITPAQGGSLRLFISKNNRKLTKRFKKLLLQEKKEKLNTFETSLSYRKNVQNIS